MIRFMNNGYSTWELFSASQRVCGVARERVEDWTIVEEDAGIFGVADGVGGNLGGAEASEFVGSVVAQQLMETPTLPLFRIDDARAALNRAVDEAICGMFEIVRECPELRSMSTTLAIGWIVDGTLYHAHAGDSRIYLLRDRQLSRLTRDHSYVEEIESTFTKDELWRNPYRHTITRCIGPYATDSRLEIGSLSLLHNDRLLFVTDGITDFVDDTRIETLANNHNRNQLARQLVRTGIASGSSDDLSCVVVDCVGSSLETPSEVATSRPWFLRWLTGRNGGRLPFAFGN